MAEGKNKYRIFLSAAEPSGDAHCAALVTAFKNSSYDIELAGVGGEKMRQAGCELLELTTARAAMTYKAFGQILYFRRLIKRLNQYFKTNPADLVIVCDSPAFNFHVAKAAKKHGAKTLFYVAPQLWAWAPWRIRKLKKWCDKLCCILPFEQQWFGTRKVQAEFVGNPLLEKVKSANIQTAQRYTNFNPDNAKIAIMPGSRNAEIETLWIAMQQIAVNLKEKYKNAKFTTVAVDDKKAQILKSKQIDGFDCDYQIGSVHDTAAKSDFAIVASGSATLQVAAAGCPMVIMYQTSPVLWHLAGRWLVTTKYLSLVNILAQKKLVPEFMPYFISTEPIIKSIENLLDDKTKLTQTSQELVELTKPLSGHNVSEQVCRIALKMLC
ncbi:MAG: lipid-A-disaccharide synthase [Phycisphaerae bacterium]